jgi:hypothetical protein
LEFKHPEFTKNKIKLEFKNYFKLLGKIIHERERDIEGMWFHMAGLAVLLLHHGQWAGPRRQKGREIRHFQKRKEGKSAKGAWQRPCVLGGLI